MDHSNQELAQTTPNLAVTTLIGLMGDYKPSKQYRPIES